MNTSDLRRSNAIYIFRAIVKGYLSAEEIAKEYDMSIIAVKKILYNLYDKNLISKYKSLENSIGRPKIYFGLNMFYHSTLVKMEKDEFKIMSVNIKGDVAREFSFPLHYNGLSENGSLRMLRAVLRDQKLEYNLGVYLIGEGVENLDNLSLYKLSSSKYNVT